jgi:hypothetical protein
VDTYLGDIGVLDGEFIVSFLLDEDTVFGGLALAEEVDTVFVFVLDLVGRSVGGD